MPTSIFLISSSPSAARLKSSTAAAAADDIADADDRFLRDLARAFAGNGKNRGAKKREPKGDAEGGPASRFRWSRTATQMPNDAICAIAMSMKMIPAPDDMQAEINQQPGQQNAGHDRPEHYVPHGYFSAAARLLTRTSINLT